MVSLGLVFVAGWSVLVNITCTMILLLFRPFCVGDEIGFAGEEIKGTVVDLTMIYTTLLHQDGRQFQMPNSMFLQKTIVRIRNSKRGLPGRNNFRQTSLPASMNELP